MQLWIYVSGLLLFLMHWCLCLIYPPLRGVCEQPVLRSRLSMFSQLQEALLNLLAWLVETFCKIPLPCKSMTSPCPFPGIKSSKSCPGSWLLAVLELWYCTSPRRISFVSWLSWRISNFWIHSDSRRIRACSSLSTEAWTHSLFWNVNMSVSMNEIWVGNSESWSNIWIKFSTHLDCEAKYSRREEHILKIVQHLCVILTRSLSIVVFDVNQNSIPIKLEQIIQGWVPPTFRASTCCLSMILLCIGIGNILSNTVDPTRKVDYEDVIDLSNAHQYNGRQKPYHKFELRLTY